VKVLVKIGAIPPEASWPQPNGDFTGETELGHQIPVRKNDPMPN